MENSEELFALARKYSSRLFDITQDILEKKDIASEKIPPKPKVKIIGDFVQIPQGKFLMGSNDYVDEKPRHHVNINYDFAMKKYQVSTKEYLDFVKQTDSNYPEWLSKSDKISLRTTSMTHYKNINLNDDAPIVGISWENAKAYCKWLSQKDGKQYRLPTEAEWEYACRATSTTRYNFGDNENLLEKYAWYNKNSEGRTHAIGTKEPNDWEIFDMHGNVWEWCEDIWVDNYDSTPRDGSANRMGNERVRVLRGGSWVDSSRYVRSSNRNGFDADGCDNDLGFRLVIDGLLH